MIQPVFTAGETYPCAMDIDKAGARQYWLETPTATYVAYTDHGELAGSYYIRPNQPSLGSHVCNCGYIVNPAMRGRGLATSLCLHSQEQARRPGR
ncbi:MAG: GNAT family N-acetyltransferase [Rhizobiales bacterium]|nr:GNAT family N-acetyltransferase [Hyphomicrobiales bacterium]